MSVTAEATPAPVEQAGTRTLPGRLLEQADTRGGTVALRVKRLGRWMEISWAEYAERAAKAALGLHQLGVGTGDRVAILSENRPEWLYGDLAVQGIGAITVGVYPTGSEEDVVHVLRDSGAKVVIVEDEEQLDKTLVVKDQLPELTKIVIIDTRGIRALDDPMTISLDQLENLGEMPARGERALWREHVDAVRGGDDVAVVVYSSGVAGPPRGAQLSHANLLAAARTLTDFFGARDDEEVLSYLPLCHVAERLVSAVTAVHAGYVVNFGEGGEAFLNDLRDVQPTFFLGVPRVWEKLMGSVQFRIRNASWLKRRMYRFWRGRGENLATGRRRGHRSGPVSGALGWLFLTRSLRRKLGLARVRIALSGAAPIAPEVLDYFWSLGVPLREIYGQTENTALATANPASDVRLGTVGPALPGVTLRLTPDGEILVRSPGTFIGYLGDRAATGEVLDSEGWLHSGDLGQLDEDGYLTITGRTKDVLVTAGGVNVSPSAIENRLKVSPFVREAMVIGDRRPYLTALLDVEADAIAAWAGEHDIQFASIEELVGRPDVHRLLDGQVGLVNRQLGDAEQIRAFEILPEALDDVGALTPTQKIRRARVEQQFGELIERMYAGE